MNFVPSFIKYLTLMVSLLICSEIKAQNEPFQILLEPIDIQGLGGLQSYSYGQHEGKWLIIGGRLDGLHRRQPFAAFDIAGHNNQLIVIDPATKEKWSAPLTSLPVGIQEQLSSTNMEFYQEGNDLYCLGGYGYSATLGDHTTFDKLTAIRVPDVIQAIIQKSSFNNYFRQITELKFQVTGGKLKKIDDTYYLLGGQKFIGRYNPMGSNHGPGFTQVYTNSIRKFHLQDDGAIISITHLPSYVDAENLHRRDYNAEAQILPNGKEGITMFSGVFQQNADLPFLNSVTIDENSYAVDNDFQQYYNHYHCAVLPLYSNAKNEMHNVFFGGIAQYYDDNGILVKDDNVPFTKTIARVTRNNQGTLAEYKLPVDMPILLGAGAEFIHNLTLPHFKNEVVDLDNLSTDTTMVGYIYGGINATDRNVFFTNTGTESAASSQIFKVHLIKNNAVGVHDLNKQSIGTLKMQVYPNPNNGDFLVKYYINKTSTVKILVQNALGEKLLEIQLKDINIGENTYEQKLNELDNIGIFFLTIETSYEKATQKIVVER